MTEVNEFYPVPDEISFERDIARLREYGAQININQRELGRFRVDLYRAASQLIPWEEIEVIEEEYITVSIGFFPERWCDPILLWLNKYWPLLSAPAFKGKEKEKFKNIKVPIKWKKEIHREFVKDMVVQYCKPERIPVRLLESINREVYGVYK